MNRALRVTLPFAVAMLVYGNTLWNHFAMDDNVYVLGNPMVTRFTWAGLFKATGYSNVFRPFTFWTLALNWTLGKRHAWGYHLVNLMLHAVVCVLLYLVLKNLLESVPRGEMAAWTAVLIFAVHPIHTEAVASIANRSELLAMGFLLGAWLLHLNERPILALVCFLLALLSKESAVAYVPLAVAGDYARGKLKPMLQYGAIAATALGYLGWLWKAQGGQFGEKSVNFLDNPLAYLPASLRIPNAVLVAWKYFGLHVYPAALSCDYSYNAINLYANLWRTGPAVVAALLVVALWLWALWTKRNGWFLAGAIYFGGFAATANILVPTGTIMGERLAYLPSAGFCLLVALIWIHLESRQRTAAWIGLAMVLAALGLRTVVRNEDWHDNYRLFESGVHVVPGSAKMHSNLGLELYFMDQVDAAKRELQTAFRIFPNLPDASGYMGLIDAREGRNQEAREHLEKALSMTPKASPNYDFIAVNLAAVEMKMGANEDALKLLEEEIATAPTSDRAWSNRGVIRYQRGELTLARSDAEIALRLNPTNSQAQNLLGVLSSSNQPGAPGTSNIGP